MRTRGERGLSNVKNGKKKKEKRIRAVVGKRMVEIDKKRQIGAEWKALEQRWLRGESE